MVGERFPRPDEVFQERYLIVSEINRGGFGRVYRAQQVELKRDVAIKILQPVQREGIDADEEEERLEVVAKRFEREAQLVSQLRDSHTVMMHDYGTTDEGLLYMVLEFIDGKALDEVIAREGAMAPDRVVKISRQVLSSLEEAHHLNMLHRDIKPGNIMLFDHAGRTDQVKVLDFGLAKSVESGDFRAENPDLTGEEVILGTPRYMSPEQIRGEGIGPATDVYSLGLVMYEMLTGVKAVAGDSTMTTLARHLNDVPIQLPLDVDIPQGLREIVNRMLRKRVSERVESAAAAMRLLDQWDDPSVESIGGALPFVDDERQKQMLLYIGAAVMALFLLVGIISAIGGGDSTDVPDGDGVVADGETTTAGDPEGAELAAGIEPADPVKPPVVGDDIAVEPGPPAEEPPKDPAPTAKPTADPTDPTADPTADPTTDVATDTEVAPEQPADAADEADDGFEFGAAGDNPTGDDVAPTEASEQASEQTTTETKSTNRPKSGNKKTRKKSTGLKLRTLK